MRYRTKFWISTDGTIDTRKDFETLLGGFPAEADRIKTTMRQCAVAAAQGNLRGASAVRDVKDLQDFMLVLGDILQSDLSTKDLIKIALEAIERTFRRKAEKQSAPRTEPMFRWTKSYPGDSHRQRLRSIIDYVRGRGKKSYEVQVAIPSFGQEYFVDLGFDVERVADVIEITYWKVKQGEGKGY